MFSNVARFQHKAFLDLLLNDLVIQNTLYDFIPLQTCSLYSALRNIILFSFQDGPYLFIPVLRAQPAACVSQLDGGWPCWWLAVCVWEAFHHSPGLSAQTSQSLQIHDRLLDQLRQDWVIRLPAHEPEIDHSSYLFRNCVIYDIIKFVSSNALAN